MSWFAGAHTSSSASTSGARSVESVSRPATRTISLQLARRFRRQPDLPGDGREPTAARRSPIGWQYDGYVQDNWHATNRLTLNLGLRYELRHTEFKEENDLRQASISPRSR